MITRRDVFRKIAGVAAAVVAAPVIAEALPSPKSGQTPPKPKPREVEPPFGEPWDTTHWWERPVLWLGDPLDHNHPLSWWATGPLFSQSEYLDAMEFHMGLQWPQDVMEMRMRQNRPSLTINMISRIVERALIVSRDRGEPTELTDADWRRVFVNAYRRNRDAQLHYNALQSARVEMFALSPKQIWNRPLVASAWVHSDTPAAQWKPCVQDPDRPMLTFDRLFGHHPESIYWTKLGSNA